MAPKIGIDVAKCLSEKDYATITDYLTTEVKSEEISREQKLKTISDVLQLYRDKNRGVKALEMLNHLHSLDTNVKVPLLEYQLQFHYESNREDTVIQIIEELYLVKDEMAWLPETSHILAMDLFMKEDYSKGIQLLTNALALLRTTAEIKEWKSVFDDLIAKGKEKAIELKEKKKKKEKKAKQKKNKRGEEEVKDLEAVKKEEVKDLGAPKEEGVEDLGAIKEDEVKDLEAVKEEEVKDLGASKEDEVEDLGDIKEVEVEDLGDANEEEVKDLEAVKEEEEKKKEVEGKKDLSVEKKEEKEVEEHLGFEEMLAYLDDCKEKELSKALKQKEWNLRRKGKDKKAKPVKEVEGDNGEGEKGEEAEDDNKEGEVKRNEEEQVNGSDLEINMEEDETEIQGELKLGEAVAVDKGIQDLKYEFEMHIVPQKICDLKTRQSYKGFIKTNAASFPKSFIEAQVPHERNCLDLIQLTCKDLSLLRVEFLMHDDHNCNYLVTEPVDSVESYFWSKLEALSDKPKSNGEWWKRMQDIFWRIFRDVLRGLMFLFDQNLSCGNIGFNVYVTENERGKILPSMQDTKDMKKDLRDLKSIMKCIIQLSCPEDKEDSYLPEDLKAFFDIIGETDFKWKHIPAAFLADYPFFWDCREKVDFTLKTRKLFRKRRDVLEDIDNELELLRVFENWTDKPVGVYYEVFDYASQRNRKGYKSKDDIVRYSYAVFTHVNELDYKSSRNDKFYNDDVIEKELSVYFPDYYRGLFKGLCMCVERGHIPADDLKEVCTVYYKQS